MSRRNVTYIKPAEPAFLKRIKEKVGYKEGPTIETKRQRLQVDTGEGDTNEHDDEKPMVVVLQPGDLSQEEADEFLRFKDKDEDVKDDATKFTFKKPEKLEKEVENVTRTKNSKAYINKKNDKKTNECKKVKNKCLLSFDDEEHDDEGD